MSAQAPQTLEGTQAPSQIEFLWERYRPLVWTVLAALACALGANYGIKYFNQKATDKAWSGFSATVSLESAYTDLDGYRQGLAESLRTKDLAALEAAVGTASDSQKPFLLLAIARKAMMEGNWDRAESALKDIETKFPSHSLVMASDYPIQVRESVKRDPKTPDRPNKDPELKPTRPGSAVALVRDQIAAARSYAAPAHFARVAPPADAKRVKFELSNGTSFVIALMHDKAPKHVEAFLRLASEAGGFWKGMAVDEIRRPTGFMGQPREMHIGFETTKEDDRTKWTTTDPSKGILDFESNDLSHFAGAVSGRNEADGKSCADRFWISAEDAAQNDGERVVFGYVVEGLESVRAICDESMSSQEEQAGRGRPTANIRVTAVTVL